MAICEAEFVGHKVTSSRSSSSVQRDMAGLRIMAAPASGAMTSDPCGDTLAILVFSTAVRQQSDRTLTFDVAAHHLAWLINRDAPYRVKNEPIRRLAFGAPVQRGCTSCVSAARTTPLLEGVAPTGGACFLSLPVLLAKLRQRRSRPCERGCRAAGFQPRCRLASAPLPVAVLSKTAILVQVQQIVARLRAFGRCGEDLGRWRC